MKIGKEIKRNQILMGLIVLLALIIRGFAIGSMPAGVNQDEAYAGYEAYSLLHYGIDSHGYHNPVYFISWGSGMNVLYSYLTIPFIRILGLSSIAIRLPQMIVSILTILYVYKIEKEIHCEVRGLILSALLAISPWHIMMSRWGLESNLAPAFLIFGLYFWIKGIKNSKYFIFSALFYGISLYSYAVLWILVPIILLLEFLYSIFYKKIKIDKFVIFALILLCILAIPLFIFLLINYGYLDEIKTNIISIPKLTGFRNDETGFTNFIENLSCFIKMIYTQSDGLLWNSTEKYGLYYPISMVFILIGGIWAFICFGKSFLEKKFQLENYWILNFIATIILASIISGINVNKINAIHIIMLYFCATGIYKVIPYLKRKKIFLILMYSFLSLSFLSYYFTDYNKLIAKNFEEELGQAIAYIQTKDPNKLYLDDTINYAKYLYYTKYPTDKFFTSVKYKNYPSKWLQIDSFEGIQYGINLSEISLDSVYLYRAGIESEFEKLGFQIKKFGDFQVAFFE